MIDMVPVRLERKGTAIVSAVVKNGESVLLVRQPGPAGPGTVWALPGGRVDPGELVVEAIVRELLEETGLDLVGSNGRLLCIGQLVNPTAIQRDAGEIPAPGETATVFLFGFEADLSTVTGEGDPDEEIDEVAWVNIPDAQARLQDHPFPFMRAISSHALQTYTQGTASVDLLCFRRNEHGDDLRVNGQS